MNEIEELYQLLQGKVKTGSLEEFTQRMQNPKSLAAVKKYAQERYNSIQLTKGGPTFSVKPDPLEKELNTAKAVDRAEAEKQNKSASASGVNIPFKVNQGEQYRLPTKEEEATFFPPYKEKILTGLEAVPIAELQTKRKATEERLNVMGQQFDDQAFNELTTKATALQQELQSLLPEVEKGASKQKSTFATLQAGLKEKETELQQIASKLDAAKPLEEELKLLAAQHKAAKTPEQANALAAAYNTKLGEYTAATSGATKEYNEKLAKYTEEVKLANAKVAKLSPAALTRYNAIIRELKTIENDPAMAKRSQMADEYNALIAESKKLTTELKNRMPDGPLEQFTMTSPTYRAERQRIIFEKLTPEQKAKEMRSSLFLSETTYNPQGEVTAKLNGFESYEEMRLATTAGLAAADLKQKPVPLTKEQVEAMNSFIQENYADMPATSIAELEAHLTDMAGTSPNNFWRTVKQTTTGRPVAAIANSIISSPVTGVLGMFTKEEAGVKEVTKARILEEAYASKLGKVKSRMSDLEVAIDSDPALLEEYRTFAESSAVINELQDKKRTAEEDQKLDEAYTAIGNLQTTEMKEYAALMQQYKSDYKNLASVVNYFPEELARRTALSLKNNQTVINDNDTMIVKTAKQLDAIKGAATNTALRIGGNTLKTLTTLGDRIDRAVTGEEYTSATERYFEETGKFLESAIFLPELPEDMRSTIVQDLMGNSKIRGQAVLPGIATGIVQMGALIFGAKGMTAPLGGGLIGSSRALTASGFVFEFNDIYESFLDAGLSSREALGYAAGISYVVARAEGISPQGVGISFFDQSVKKAITKLAKTGAKDFGTAFTQGSLHILKELGQENLQEFVQDGLKTVGNYLINKGYGTDLDGSFDTPEIAETALITTGTTLVFSLLNGKSQIRGEAYSAAKYLAEKPEQLEEELQRRVSEGKLDMDMARDIFNFVTKVKETVDANKAKEAFDKKIEGYSPQKPMVEDYEGPTEITVDEYFAADYMVPTGVIVNWDDKKYQVTKDEKGTTLTLMEEAEAPAPIEEQIEKDDEEYNRLVDIVNKQDRRVGDPLTPEEQQLMDMASAREATKPELKPTKTKLTAAEFNELVQAPTGERIPTEIESAQVAEYQGKEYNVTKVEGDQVTLTNFAGTAQMTVPVSEVTPFTVEPLQTIQFEGKDHKVNTAQRDLIGAIDSHEQQQINAINNSTLTDGQKKTKIKTLQDSLNRSRREVLGIKEDMQVGGTAYYGGKPVKIKKLTKNTAKIELDGVETTVQRSALSLSDTTPLDEAAAQLKQRGHTFTLHAGKPMSKQDTDAYMKTDSRTAKIVGRVKQLLPVLAKSGIKIKVFSDVQSAEEAALELGADSRAVRGIRHDGKEVLTEEYLGNGISQVTYEDGTTANVPQVEIQYTTFNGFFDPKTNQIIINAQAAAASTVEHEFLHPIIESILANNPETVVRFFNELKQLPEWADLKDFVDQYDANEQPIEALIEFTARVISPEFKFKARPATFKRKVVDFFQRLFGIDPTIKINTNNVLDFATSLKESFEKGIAFNIGETKGGFSIRAYQGTPHDFPKEVLVKAPNGNYEHLVGTPESYPSIPSGYEVIERYPNGRMRTDKIGTGEGVQAFGWGLYFTELEDIARWYAEKLYQEKWEVDKLDVKDFENTDFDIIDTVYLLQALRKGHNKFDNTYNKSKSLSFVEERMRYSEKEIWKKVYDKIKNAKTINPIISKNLYDVTLHKDKTEYNWLEWDKPVDGSVLGELRKALNYPMWSKFEPQNGAQVYHDLSKWLGSDKAASLFLSEAGIDGVKYPAESLSGKQARGFNYVIFDENAVTVNEKIRFSKQTLAPNGKPSNLTPEQYAQVRTPEFIRFFGDWLNDPENASKVVDENGEPLVVYHGTSQRGLTEFYGGWWSANKAATREFGNERYAAFLNIRNPLEDAEMLDLYNGQNETEYEDVYDLDFNLRDYFAARLANLPNDGIITFDDSNAVSDMAYVVKEPTQIKSATENVGSFSPTNPDIRFSKATTSSNKFSKAYHKGTLSAKSEGVGSTISGSEVPYTGYFFVSSENKLKGRQRAMAGGDLKTIDLSQYNLYDPKTNANYFKVMDALRQIPTIGTRERLEAEIDKAISNLPQDLRTQIADIKSDILDALVANSALAEQRRAEPSDGKNVVDKSATVVLKRLGYEGVNAAVSLSDPNLQDPDSTGYGTVIFDLKEGTVESAMPIRFQKSFEDAYYDYKEVYDEQLNSIVRDYRNGVKKQYPLTLKPTVVERVWNRYIRTGEIDEDQLIKIERVFIRNTALLEINTALSGHTSENPDYILEEVFDDEIPEDFYDWFYDYSGTISDYGLKPLQERAVKLLMEENPSKRLQLLDEMLNIIHQRDDLSEIFVDGGIAGLDFIGGYHQAIPPPPPNERRNYGREDVFGRFSKALTIPEMDLSFDKFRDLAQLWKLYHPTKTEDDFYRYVKERVDRRVNKGFISAAFNDDPSYTARRMRAEMDTSEKKNLKESKAVNTMLRDPGTPQFLKDKLKELAGQYGQETHAEVERTANMILEEYGTQGALDQVANIPIPSVRVTVANKLIKRLNEMAANETNEEKKAEIYYTNLQLMDSTAMYLRQLGQGVRANAMYSKMDKDGYVYAVNRMLKATRGNIKKRHKTAIDSMVAYAQLVARGQRAKILTEDQKTEILSGGKTREQIRGLKERAAEKLRAYGAAGFSVSPLEQDLLEYGYYEFLDGRQDKASWVRHMKNKGLARAEELFDKHDFGSDPQNPQTLASMSTKIDNLVSLIGTKDLAAEIGQEMADMINKEHRKRVVATVKKKYERQLKKKGFHGQMAQALITAVEEGNYNTQALEDAMMHTMGEVQLSPEEIAEIDQIYKDAGFLPEGRLRDEKLAEAWDMIYRHRQDQLKYSDVFWAFYYANILSGPGTQALNFFENALNLVLEPAVQSHPRVSNKKRRSKQIRSCFTNDQRCSQRVLWCRDA
jgi:hypothetical protein